MCIRSSLVELLAGVPLSRGGVKQRGVGRVALLQRLGSGKAASEELRHDGKRTRTDCRADVSFIGCFPQLLAAPFRVGAGVAPFDWDFRAHMMTADRKYRVRVG